MSYNTDSLGLDLGLKLDNEDRALVPLYIRNICSRSISQQQQRYSDLQKQHDALTEQLKQSVSGNTDVILSCHSRLKSLNSGMSDKLKQNGLLLSEDVQTITQMPIHKKEEKSTNNNNSKYNPALVLKNIDNLTDILTLPTLATECISNGMYHETLEIASHVRRLSIRYPNIEVIEQINIQMNKVLKKLANMLVRLLKSNVRQGMAMKIIGYLRRLQHMESSSNSTTSLTNNTTFTSIPLSNSLLHKYSPSVKDENETLLQQIYLSSHQSYIESQFKSLESLKKTDPAKYMKRYIEVIREHVFSVVMSYDAIFNFHSASNLPREESTILEDDDNGKIFIIKFIRSIILQLRTTMAQQLPKISDQLVRDGLVLQLGFCVSSLGRVGAEFWGILGIDGVIEKKEWVNVMKKKS